MTDLSPDRLPPRDGSRSRGRPRKPGLQIDFDPNVDPLATLDTAEAASPPDPAPAPGAEPANAAAEPWPEGAPASAEACVRRPARPAADPEAAARLLGVPTALARIEVVVAVEVGRRRMPLAELVAAEPGALIPLDRLTDEPVDILVNGKPFGRGEIVAIGENFGVRLLDLADGAA
ncbi:FliM/FliN family flagellar motor switch protein [Thermaurantiacus sp.]